MFLPLSPRTARQAHSHLIARSMAADRCSLLRSSFFLHADSAHAISALSLLELVHVRVILVLRASVFLLEDGISLNGLELGLEIGDVVVMAAGIGAAASVGEVVASVLRFLSRGAPIDENVRKGTACL